MHQICDSLNIVECRNWYFVRNGTYENLSKTPLLPGQNWFRQVINTKYFLCHISFYRYTMWHRKKILNLHIDFWPHENCYIGEIEALPDDVELFYADESGFDEYYSREYGYAPRGEKVVGKISGKHFTRTSIVAAKNGIEKFGANVKRRLRLHMHKFTTFWKAFSHAFK